jgi:hypothetical protein
VLVRYLRHNNHQIGSIMKLVWFMIVLYSGLLGLMIYFNSGRRQISRDSLWRKGFLSVAHCYSGCRLSGQRIVQAGRERRHG